MKPSEPNEILGWIELPAEVEGWYHCDPQQQHRWNKA